MTGTRTGDHYAAKTIHKPIHVQNGSRKRELDEDMDCQCLLKQIRKEVTIMRENPHVSMTP